MASGERLRSTYDCFRAFLSAGVWVYRQLQQPGPAVKSLEAARTRCGEGGALGRDLLRHERPDLGLDAGTGWIVAATLTAKDVDDGAQVGPLLDQVGASVASFTADGGDDQEGVSAAVAARHPDAAIIVPLRATAVPSETAETEPTQRDHHLRHIAEHGRAAW